MVKSMKAYQVFCLGFVFATGLIAEPLRDPTLPGNDGISNKNKQDNFRQLVDQWHLQAIFISDNRRAVINGKSLTLGDSFDGFRVVAIEHWYVQLVSGQTNIKLKLADYSENAKQ